ncbi:unnamed protein product [Durusdinium trenchii]|uniref:Uncharacterized protein n=2 Tax=Durusdinium trenchii TaxID=1381693 RepID=A0ABP0KAR9_9DINO
MAMDFKLPSGCYTESSVKELRAFLSCTHRRIGEGSLPWRLAQRGPQLLLIIAEFLLAPRVVLYAGCEDGRIKVLELMEQEGSRIKEVQLVATPNATSQSRFWTVGCPQRVSGLAVGDGWLLAAMFSGTLRIFLLPSHDEQVSTHLKVLLPPQSPVIVRCTGLVASRRALYVVNLRHGDILQEVPLLFAARPCIIAEGQSVFVQCDEAIRVWKCSALLQCQADTTEPLAMPQDFWNPHRQMLVGMAVLPGGEFLATACPEEIRGWAWPPDDVKGSAPHLLWTVPTGSFCGGGWEATSLLWVPSTGHTGRLAVFGDCDGSLVVWESQLCTSFQDKPGSLTMFQLPGPLLTHSAVPSTVLGGTVWSEAAWFSWGLTGAASPLRACLEQDAGSMVTVISSLACCGPVSSRALPRLF